MIYYIYNNILHESVLKLLIFVVNILLLLMCIVKNAILKEKLCVNYFICDFLKLKRRLSTVLGLVPAVLIHAYIQV